MTAGSDNVVSQLLGTQLFTRAMSLQIGYPNDPSLAADVAFNSENSSGLDVLGLAVTFVVTKSLKPTEPNTCELKIRNLSPKSRDAISGAHPLTVKLEAGYVGGTSQLYFAEARGGWTTRERADFITTVESIDTVARPTGVRKTKKPQPGTGTLYRTPGPRVPVADAFRAIAKALGIGEGNLNTALANLHGTSLTSLQGSALLGPAGKRMTDLCRSAGLEWSVQDGNLQLLNVAQALSTTRAVQMSASTGMIGSPAVDSNGAVAAKSLIIPGLAPGVLVNFDSDFVQGGYRVEKCRYNGNTVGADWYVEFDAIAF